jgi:pimeloyl-ACP methyl ester carboxylesterase
MPYANNQGVKIYYEVEGQGPPLILAHGMTGNLTAWQGYGYVDLLKQDVTVILFDARGHGKSDKPHHWEAYRYERMAEDVVAVLNALGVERAHYWGYSMGGYIGFGLAQLFPHRLVSLIVGGASPYSDANPNEPSEEAALYRRGAQEGVEIVIEDIRASAGSITPQYEARIRSLDLLALAACREYWDCFKPGLESALSAMSMPSLLYAGDANEPTHSLAQKAANQMTSATFLSLSGLNHLGAGMASDLLVPRVCDFILGVA